MPRFIPRSINRNASTIIKAGMNLLIRFLTEIPIKFPASDTASITGKVPIPKRNIYNAPSRYVPEAIAPATAT
jgi:hypothetical protein